MQLVNTDTGEYIPAGAYTLDTCASEARQIIESTTKNNWRLGELLSIARALCDKKDCGYEGKNPDERFGNFVSENFADTRQRAMFNYRCMHEVFGHRQDLVEHIPQSALYALAQPKCDDFREAIISALPDTVQVKEIESLIKKAVQEKKDAVQGERKTEYKKALSKTIDKNAPQIFKSDCIEYLKTFDDNSIDLLLTDPPYSTDIDDIQGFAQSWVPVALDKVKASGRAFICIGAYPKELQAYLNVLLLSQDKFIVDNPLIWTYRNTLGQTPKMKYNLNYQVILHLYSDKSAPLDTSVTGEMFSVQDINAPDGRQGDRLHTWQKPIELGLRLVKHTTSTGDLVVDPFCCTGTFLLAAARLGREATGCDIDVHHLEIARESGCVLAG